MKKPVIFLSGMSLLALLLRLFHLDFQSFWHDEILSVMLAEGTWKEIYKNSYIMTNVPPFYYYVISPFTKSSASEFFLRLPSVLFAVFSVVLFYDILKKLTDDRSAKIGVLILSVSAFHIWYSQEARPYSMLIFIALLSLWLLLKVLVDNKGFVWLIGFVLSTAALFYCHTLGIAFIGFLFTAAILYSPRKEWLKWVGIFTLIGVLVSPALWELYVLPKLRSADSFREFDVLAIPYTFWVFISGYTLGPSVPELHSANHIKYIKEALIYIVPIGLFFSALFGYGLWVMKKKNRPSFWLVLAWIFIPGFFAILGSLFSNQPFNARYVLLVFPAILVVLSAAMTELPGVQWRRIAVSIFLLVNIISLANNYFNSRYFREDNRSASHYFSENADKNDLAICSAFYAKKGLLYYTRYPEEKVIGYRPSKFETRPEIIVNDLQEIIGERDRFWFYLSRNYNKRQVAVIRQFFDKSFNRVIDKKFVGVELTYYKRKANDDTNNAIQ
ncbi:MAG: glycosyltransferase family 39 protein [Deferribacteres bacterium]|nr:glycosyltransferase family 39 protein [candidate division KSB1 bacterium]MCB9501469.1 glycosyltransferase family 39 protein [Deferribacteres bacterium]